ncbi:MAG TPA: acyl-CoA thioester hydrolase/BAAT C-terminal domain-containing protein [Paenalcaligenes sp.]|nr:acyl-CoA thioester hydrolase/BAAT C-terminal domain-containing protein [Paenalcaligenes sp.]
MLTLKIEPADALIDVERQITVTGAQPGAQVEISATTVRQGVRWASYAIFEADAQGQVNVATQDPLEGSTYDTADAMGLIWSQVPQVEGARQLFNQSVFDAIVTNLSVSSAGQGATTTMTQRLATEGVKRIELDENGLVGTLFLPDGPGPHPGIMVLNGSGGGINEPRAALYASHGYAALALGYFKTPGRPDYISNTHLEYFLQAMQWLRAKVALKNDFLAVSGQSRGGELALLLGSTFRNEVSAVMAYVPSAFVHSAQNAADPAVGREGPTWLLDGKPLRHIWENNRYASWAPFDEGEPPYRHELAMLTALEDKEAIEPARIRVENINGPVVLLSATDDGSWPSSLYCQMIVDRLKAHQFPHAVEWVDVQDAGHAILFPYVPTTQIVYSHPVSKRVSTGGGEPAANAKADRLSWRAVLNTLNSAVKNGTQ